MFKQYFTLSLLTPPAGYAALLIYDYILTFADEVEFIWGRELRTTSVFYLNRITTIGLAATGILNTLSWSSNAVCHILLGYARSSTAFIPQTYVQSMLHSMLNGPYRSLYAAAKAY